jgi:hypothetical protein
MPNAIPKRNKAEGKSLPKGFGHMLLFARWFNGIIFDRAHVFEIQLPALQRHFSRLILLCRARSAGRRYRTPC